MNPPRHPPFPLVVPEENAKLWRSRDIARQPTYSAKYQFTCRARFYAVALQADLLAGWTVVREWGIGSAGTVRVDLHQNLAPAMAAAERVTKLKRGRGYR